VEASYRDGSLSGSVGIKGFPVERIFGSGLSGEIGVSAILDAAAASVSGNIAANAGNADRANSDPTSLDAKPAPGLVSGMRGELDATFSFDGLFDPGRAELSGFPPSSFSARLVHGEFNSVPLSLSFAGSMTKGIFGVTDIDASYINHEVKSASLSLDPAAGAIEFAIPYSAVFGNDRLRTVILGSGTSGAPIGSSFASIVDSYNLKLTIQSLIFRKLEMSGWRADVLSQNGTISIAGEKDEILGRYDRDGNFELKVSRPVPVVASVKGRFKDGIVDADVTDFAFDFSELGSDTSADLIRIREGTATGSFKVSGALGDPDLDGTLDLKNAVVMLQGYLDEPIGPFSVPLVLDGKNLYFSAPKVSIGDGVAELSLQASLDHWNLAGLRAKLDTKGNATVGVSG
jgi:hypothetical protein